MHSEKAPGWSAARRVAPSDPYTGWRWSWAVVIADLQAWLDGAHAMTWQAAGVFMHSDALVDSPVEKMDLVPTAALQEARAMTQRIGVEAPRTHRGSRQWLQRWRRRRRLRLWRLHPGGLWMEGGYMARPARRCTRKIKPWLPCFKVSASGSAKNGVQFSASVLRPRLQRQV